MKRRNGLQRPWHPQQVASWVGYAAYVTAFYTSVSRRLNVSGVMYWEIAYGIVAVNTVAFAFLVTSVNPEDPVVALEQEAHIQSRPYDSTNYPRMCRFCIAHTKVTTKHCSFCKKCVAAYDHHCNWINNCVAGRNYVYFMSLICSLEVMMAGFIGAGVSVIEKLLVHGSPGEQTEASILLALLILGFCVLLLNTVLILFHIYLRCVGSTTAAFLKRRRNNRFAKTTPQHEVSKPTVNMSHDLSASQDQPDQSSIPITQQDPQFSACRQPAEELNLRS